MSSGVESSTYRRAAMLQARRLGTAPPPPVVPQPIPARCLTPEFRRAKQLEARRLGLPEPNFGPGFSNPPAAPAPFDPWDTDLPSGLKRTGAPAPTNAQPTANAAPGKPLSAMDRRAMYLNDVRQFGFEGQRLPEGTIWSEKISRSNLKV
jgi:hypothetical protein